MTAPTDKHLINTGSTSENRPTVTLPLLAERGELLIGGLARDLIATGVIAQASTCLRRGFRFGRLPVHEVKRQEGGEGAER